MYHVLDPIGIPKDPTRTLVFVRGFQGLNNLRRKSTSSSSWYRQLRSYGYRGNILSFRWYSPAEDCRSARCRADHVEEAAGALWELLEDMDLDRVSLMGFSMGAAVIQHVLRHARRESVRFRRVYFFGGAASQHERWGALLPSVREGAWNFHSEHDMWLRWFCRDAIGVWGFGYSYYYPKTSDIDLSWYEDDPDGDYATTSHGEWPMNVGWCLERARLTPELL